MHKYLKGFIEQSRALGLLAWVFIWAIALGRSVDELAIMPNNFLYVGCIGGWLWMMLFGCRTLSWGKKIDLKKRDALVSGDEQ